MGYKRIANGYGDGYGKISSVRLGKTHLQCSECIYCHELIKRGCVGTFFDVSKEFA